MVRLFSAKSRITIGLASLLASVVLVATVLGLVPDRRAAVMEGRAKLCETMAVISSVLVTRGELRRLETVLATVTQRNHDILSAAIRRNDGTMITEVGDHEDHWRELPSDRSVDTQVIVPIRAGAEKWGGVEVRFRPVAEPGVLGLVVDPWTRLILFVTALSGVAFYFYLGRMLQHLDPSKVVPSRVRSALDTLAEGLLVLDIRGRIVLANRAFAACVGKSPDALLGCRASALPWRNPAGTGPATSHPWSEVLAGRTPPDGATMVLLDSMADERTFLVNCAPVLGQDGSSRGVLVSFEDVTQLEETKEALSRSRDAAEQANSAKSEFLAKMSHEIRTPMNAILGFTDVLLRGFAENEAQRQEYLNTIHSSGTHLLDLINDILDLSKVEAGRMEVEQLRCAPLQLISQVLSVLRVRAQEKKIALDFAADSPIPEMMMTDPVRFRQVLTNLVGNAIKFTDQGGVRVTARVVQSAGKPQLAVAVADTGVGIAPAALDRIFDPFAQADASVTRRFGGTGLGLSISKRLAEGLGGAITVRSEVGQGSVFTATFDTGPLDGVKMLDPQTMDLGTADEARKVGPQFELPGVRILVVDDGDENRKLMTLVLRRAGATVETATNGQLAVELARANAFDVILMDMQMPVMDGYTAASTLRRHGYQAPIIALTADAMKGSEEKCRAAGCSGFLTKPIEMDLLLRTLTGTLATDRTPAMAPTPSPPI
ncbi:MAG: hypothetical protein A2W31_02480, partial [Planctomycetes bacterium RBG_16_64_10]